MSKTKSILKKSALGKATIYISQYQPDLLFAISRAGKRSEIEITNSLPFHGNDIWNAYELSWLNTQGKPIVAGAEFIFPCESPNIIESKSFKLYLNSLNNTRFESISEVQKILRHDLSTACGSPIQVKIMPLSHTNEKVSRHLEGICLDELDVTCDTYQVANHFLQLEKDRVRETVYSDLLKSNCPVTGQPDWASLQITYLGKRIQHEGLLKYIISYREHDEFHEQCVERIFTDIMQQCDPEKLLVYARYTRRGGLDINPYRANYPVKIVNAKLWRQ